ncbi:mechanosensitive ion channel domain-containing protein [uncultured Aquimarina sp.]|uniref:mechanosensitive ion channel family protein n=1 Tax=uncultured Aquimarina sp. TaxID=575652 RepID=UPI002606DB90|nr:mechanosensitive ion channel domain-containing protein [uncultured Aquimarina sp.]
MDTILSELQDINKELFQAIIMVIAILSGIIAYWLLFKVVSINQKKFPTTIKEQLIKYLKKPTKLLLPLLFLYGSLSIIDASTFWQKLLETFIILNFIWVLLSLAEAVENILKDKFQVDENKAEDRNTITQFKYLKRVAYAIIIVIGLAMVLYNIPAARAIGNTIFASAGIAGIVIGIAAQKPIGNLITGFQIAFSDTIKINDEVVIEGEYGIVEDITLTSVIVKVWDYRRLILPMSFFNDNSFVNRTYKSNELIGTVYFYVDYAFPVSELRTKLNEVLNENPLWDKNAATLVVTNIDKQAMEIRTSFSAKDSSDSWNLRCQVREQLIDYIQKTHPKTLSNIRIQNFNK